MSLIAGRPELPRRGRRTEASANGNFPLPFLSFGGGWGFGGGGGGNSGGAASGASGTMPPGMSAGANQLAGPGSTGIGELGQQGSGMGPGGGPPYRTSSNFAQMSHEGYSREGEDEEEDDEEVGDWGALPVFVGTQ